MQLVQQLPDNPIDIIGDIHGEISALTALLKHLGYSADGKHLGNRKLVFVGDLIDRGPDSPGVVRHVQHLIQQGNAYAILGNHEINLLINDSKDGAGWFFPERYDSDLNFYAPFKRVTTEQHDNIREFLLGLPLILERDDIRIVHAAWTAEAANAVRTAGSQPVDVLYQQWDDKARNIAEESGLYQRYRAEKQQWKKQLENGNYQMPMLEAIANYDATQQMVNPIKVLTSGVEAPAKTPFFVGNRWRFSDRVKWWESYSEKIPVVIGHYWRLYRSTLQPDAPRYTQLFRGIPPASWHGRLGNVMCIDYSVGARWRDRRNKQSTQGSRFRLAALRWPENILVFDSGEQVATQGFGKPISYANST